MMRTSDPYSCLVDWSSSSMSLSLSLSLKSSSWLLDNSSWSFFFSVLAFSQALARVFSFCTMQQHTGTSSVTGTGSECFGGESAGCDRTAPSSRFPVVASIRTLRSPAPPVSPAKAPPQPHSPTEGDVKQHSIINKILFNRDQHWQTSLPNTHILLHIFCRPCWPFQAAGWLSSEWWSRHPSSWEERQHFTSTLTVQRV